MIKLIDKYILKRFLSRMIFLIVGLSAIIITTNLVEMIDNFIDAKMNSSEIFNYYFLSLPMIISYAIPMSVTISTVLSIVAYIKNNELLAIRAFGVNYFRMTKSILVATLLISIFHFFFENQVVSNSNRLKNKIVRTYNLDKKNHKQNKANFLEDISNNRSIFILNYNNKTQTANKIIIKEIDENNFVKNRMDSNQMIWNGTSWDFEKILIRDWSNEKYSYRMLKDTTLNLDNINPIYLTSEFIEPDQMNYFELNEFIKIKQKNSGNTTKWKVGLNHKIAYCFSSFFMCMLSIIFSLMLKNSNVSYGIGLSLLIITIYYVILIVGKNFGIEGIISPILSAWLPNLCMLILAFFGYKKFIF